MSLCLGNFRRLLYSKTASIWYIHPQSTNLWAGKFQPQTSQLGRSTIIPNWNKCAHTHPHKQANLDDWLHFENYDISVSFLYFSAPFILMSPMTVIQKIREKNNYSTACYVRNKLLVKFLIYFENVCFNLKRTIFSDSVF